MTDVDESPAKSSFRPVADERVRLLILGSLPGEVSLSRAQYYAHPSNQFWRLLEPVVGTPLAELAYEARLRALLGARVGLWDVIRTARRVGSLDGRIRDHSPNALEDLAASLPNLRALAFNGDTAFRIGRRQLGADSRWPLVRLPSSSAAYCSISFEAKQAEWMRLRTFLVPEA